MQGTGGGHHEPGMEPVPPVGLHGPPAVLVTPPHGGDLGTEHGPVKQVEVVGDALGMGQDFRGVGVALGRDDPELFEERQVDIGLDVALGAGVLVPVPGATDATALLHDAHVGQAGLAQAGPGQQPTESTAHDEGVHLGLHRCPVGHSTEVVLGELCVAADDLEVLILAVGPQAFGPFVGIAVAEGIRVESGGWHSRFGHHRSLRVMARGHWASSPRTTAPTNSAHRKAALLGSVRLWQKK